MPGVPSGRGCDACRKQKKKCDQGRPSCARCTRLNIPCVGAGVQRFKFKQEHVFNTSQKSQQSQSKTLTTRKKPAARQLPNFEAIIFVEEIPRLPVNGVTALRNSFIETLKPTTDLRYNLAWSFGGFLADIPRRLGVNEALDSAVQVLVESHQDFCAGLGVTSRMLVGYSRALRMLRLYLDDPVKARASETLCSVMVLLMCQRFIGVSEGDFTGHCEGAAQLLRARRYYDPKDEFESKLVLSLRGPVVFEGLLNQKIQFTPEEWKTLVENHLDGVTPEGRMMRSVAKVPGLLNRARKIRKDGGTDENLLIDALAAYHLAKGAADELRIKYNKARFPKEGQFSFKDPIVMAHSFYQRSFGLSLTVAIILSCVVTGIDPDNAVVVDPSTYIDEILEIAGSATIYRPLGASFVPMCLMMAWISTGDVTRRATIEAALKAYENDYAEGQAVVMSPRVEQISRQLRLVDLDV
ncbi:hypothetical protein MGYG_02046 [Nannizzia gypsea CBS 118893]|uniref:Zn(2)-C6 fungal-type domain-containing protein n=1 Tax=Arthroderma gypseum (strain ATCC MYA-4604 / CBS 118893) TaxID=535722 RepID=E4UPE5_ARTGP|nr:hypothetical protein MGYG_02046 [Nannizzia gypsea CBS 118893]EFQ99034.1 hypothetical protein MGYG_02046 [Nannizzia gypsea CBS 118893]